MSQWVTALGAEEACSLILITHSKWLHVTLAPGHVALSSDFREHLQPRTHMHMHTYAGTHKVKMNAKSIFLCVVLPLLRCFRQVHACSSDKCFTYLFFHTVVSDHRRVPARM